MSTFVTRAIGCPHCGVEAERAIAESLQGPGLPEVVVAILGGRFQAFSCASCGGDYVVDTPLVYLDVDAGHWVHMFPRADEEAWAEREAEAERAFAVAMEGAGTLAAPEWGARMQRRTVFGLAALREKLTLLRLGIDDAGVEALKLDLLRRTDAFVWRPEAPIRVVSVGDDGLRLEQHGCDDCVTLPRAWLEHVTTEEEWAPVRAALRAGSYVDIGRTRGAVFAEE